MYLLQSMFAKNVCLLIQFILAQGYFVSLGEAWRPETTANYYAQHGLGIAHSLHCNRMAIDLIIHDSKGTFIQKGEIYTLSGQYWEFLDNRNRWGGNFTAGPVAHSDYGHFEMHDVPLHRMVKIK